MNNHAKNISGYKEKKKGLNARNVDVRSTIGLRRSTNGNVLVADSGPAFAAAPPLNTASFRSVNGTWQWL